MSLMEERLSAAELSMMVERYRPPVIPPCRICGGKLSAQAVGGGRPTVYACSTVSYIGGGREAQDHYSDSRYEDTKAGGDRRLLVLVEEVRERRRADGEEVDLPVGYIEPTNPDDPDCEYGYMHLGDDEWRFGNIERLRQDGDEW